MVEHSGAALYSCGKAGMGPSATLWTGQECSFVCTLMNVYWLRVCWFCLRQGGCVGVIWAFQRENDYFRSMLT